MNLAYFELYFSFYTVFYTVFYLIFYIVLSTIMILRTVHNQLSNSGTSYVHKLITTNYQMVVWFSTNRQVVVVGCGGSPSTVHT